MFQQRLKAVRIKVSKSPHQTNNQVKGSNEQQSAGAQLHNGCAECNG